MKRFIFRNPFITKQDRRIAKNYMEMACKYTEAASKLAEDGNDDKAAELTLCGLRMWNLAAKTLGFRNVKDMDDYIKRHGHV